MIIKPGEQKIVKIEAPFTDEISSLAIIKLLDKLTHSVMVLKVKFIHSIAMLDISIKVIQRPLYLIQEKH